MNFHDMRAHYLTKVGITDFCFSRCMKLDMANGHDKGSPEHGCRKSKPGSIVRLKGKTGFNAE